MKFTTFTMLVPLFFCATRTHLFPNNSIVSKILLNIFELIRYSIISFILFCPFLLQHKVLSWNPLYFGCKLEHLWGQASVFLNYRKCCYILYIRSFLSAFTESLTIGMLNILDCYSNFSLFIICHLFSYYIDLCDSIASYTHIIREMKINSERQAGKFYTRQSF